MWSGRARWRSSATILFVVSPYCRTRTVHRLWDRLDDLGHRRREWSRRQPRADCDHQRLRRLRGKRRGVRTGALTTGKALFKQANSQGQTVLAASGDQGATDCDAGPFATEGLTVDFPGSSPYVAPAWAAHSSPTTRQPTRRPTGNSTTNGDERRLRQNVYPRAGVER